MCCGLCLLFDFSLPWEYMHKNFLHPSLVFKTGETTVCYDLPTLAHPSHMIAEAEKPKILLMFTKHVAAYMAVNKPDSWISLLFFPRGPCCSVDEWTHQLRLQWVISTEDLLRYVWSSFQAAPSWSTSHSQRP